ncbi:MAG: hypothetical protein WA977_04520 [Halobacteriota archaeon]
MKKTGKKRGSFGFLGIPIDPTLGIGDKIVDHVEEARREEKRRLERSDFYTSCPACGRKQIKKNLIENGCFICGWKGSEEEIELAKVKKMSKVDIGSEGEKEERGYRVKCPNCNALLITEQFEKNGCYVCGFRE